MSESQALPESPESIKDEPIASSRMATLALIPSMVAFNLALAALVHALKSPLYLDCVGIIATTLIAGFWPGLIVCVLAFAMNALLSNPQIICFTGTGAMMGLYTYLLASVGGFKTIFRTVLSGIGMGVVSALVSAPVCVLVFGGVTTSGSTLVTAFYTKMGLRVWQAVLLSNATCDPADKIVECLLAVWLVRAVPRDLLMRFGGGLLGKNLKMSE